MTLAQDPQHGLCGAVLVHPGVDKPAEGADDGNHRVRRGELKSEAHPILQRPALRVARTACPMPQSQRKDEGGPLR